MSRIFALVLIDLASRWEREATNPLAFSPLIKIFLLNFEIVTAVSYLRTLHSPQAVDRRRILNYYPNSTHSNYIQLSRMMQS
jgi:hypothetical protein